MRVLLLAIAVMIPTLIEAQDRNAKPCTGGAIDSAWVSSGPVYRDCEVDQPARVRSLQRPMFVAPEGVECAVAEVEFVVDTAGRVELATVHTIETNSPEFARRLVAGLDRARYRVAERAGQPVRQLVRARVAVRDSGRVPFVVQSPNSPTPPPRPRTECR